VSAFIGPKPRSREAKAEGADPPIGSKSTLYLVVTYRHPDGLRGAFDLDAFEKKLLAREDFKPRRIDDPALLPHLDIHIRNGRLLRAYEACGRLSNIFDPRDTWLFERAPKKQRGEGTKSEGVPCKIASKPRVFVVETGYVFVVLGIRPTSATLTAFQNLYAAVVRRGYAHLLPESMPRRRVNKEGDTKPHPLVEIGEEAKLEETTIRHWLKLFIPDVLLDAPIGSWPNPMSVNVLFAEGLPDAQARHRLRLAHGSDQPIDPSASDCRIEGHPAIWEPSARELCLFSPVGVTWVIWPIDAKGVLSQFDATMLERYIYKWVLIEHERLFLLELSSSCASMAGRPDGRVFSRLRLALLQYTARFSFGHVSSEERHDRFYCGLRSALDVTGLFEEVKGEITEIDEYLSDKRADLLNQVLAFLTLVLTPVGLVIGIFERDTLPAFDFAIRDLFSKGAWAVWSKLLFHVPLWLTALSAVVGFVMFTRLLGMSTVRGLLRRFRDPASDE